MAKTDNLEGIIAKFDEVKELVSDIKNGMLEDCNNQFYSVLQTLDGLVSAVNNLEHEKSKPSDEYTILQTNILEVKKELSRMNDNIDEVISGDLKDLMSKLTEKVNRLEILTNNAGIDQQVIMNITGQIEKNLSGTLRETRDTLYTQGITSSEVMRKDISEINGNMKECVEYLEKSAKAITNDAVQHLSDDLTVLGTTVEKTTDNLKRSVIDIFSRIQEAVERGGNLPTGSAAVDTTALNNLNEHFEMLKTGLYNLNANTEQRMSKLNHVIEELELFNKLEKFSQLRDLPAIGDLKHTLQANINRIVEEYSYTLQTSQSRDELTKTTQQFRKDVYNSIVSMLGQVSEFLLDDNSLEKSGKKTQLELFSEKLDELTSVTELNNSGYDNIQIELDDVREKCENIIALVRDGNKRLGSKNVSIEETLSEMKNNLEEVRVHSAALKNQSSEIGDVVKECTQSIIESSVPDRNIIKDLLSDIKKNISILQSGDEESEYTYSMQDIEEDVAKIRIYLNELTQNGVSVNSDEFTEELNGVVIMVDSMKQQLNKIEESSLPETMSKLTEDITSISTRVNKLLLSSDNSYNMIDGALKEFKVLSEEIDTQIKAMASSNRFSNLEDNLTLIKTALAESNSYNSVINQSLIMLAEWVDSAGEMITNIYENQSKQGSVADLKTALVSSSDSVVSEVKSLLAETNSLVQSIKVPQQADYSEALNILDGKLAEQNILIEKQELRLNKLDEKLSMLLEISAKSDLLAIEAKMNDIDEKMNRLNNSIEKLTAFVNED